MVEDINKAQTNDFQNPDTLLGENRNKTQNRFSVKNGKLVKYRGNESHVVIPNTIREIGEEAFYSCRSLSSITIPESVKRIGWGAFKKCTNLKSLRYLMALQKLKLKHSWDVMVCWKLLSQTV